MNRVLYYQQAVAARWAATAWFSGLICTWQLHAASLLKSATYISKHAGANQIVTRLLRHCSGPVRWPIACGRTDRSEVTAQHFC